MKMREKARNLKETIHKTKYFLNVLSEWLYSAKIKEK